jgi:apolipoprotein D and lipocalin family protein
LSLFRILVLLVSFLLTACMGLPDNVKVVERVNASQYLGTWYEIARLDQSFERGLEKITATYTAKDDGGIKVLNRGFNVAKNEWKEAEGKAYFVDAPNADKTNTGKLKVSFFGPFYGAYNIITLDANYQHVMICGPDKSYLWILSRAPKLAQPIKQALVAQAKAYGFETGKLIYVKHD